MLIPGDPNIRSYPSLTKKFRKPVAPNKNQYRPHFIMLMDLKNGYESLLVKVVDNQNP